MSTTPQDRINPRLRLRHSQECRVPTHRRRPPAPRANRRLDRRRPRHPAQTLRTLSAASRNHGRLLALRHLRTTPSLPLVRQPRRQARRRLQSPRQTPLRAMGHRRRPPPSRPRMAQLSGRDRPPPHAGEKEPHRLETNATARPLRYLLGFIPVVLPIRNFFSASISNDEELARLETAWTRAVLLHITLWSRPYTTEGLW